MLKRLKKEKLYHVVSGAVVDGPNPDLWGNCSNLWGDCSDLRGDCTGLRGDIQKCTEAEE